MSSALSDCSFALAALFGGLPLPTIFIGPAHSSAEWGVGSAECGMGASEEEDEDEEISAAVSRRRAEFLPASILVSL